MLSTVSSTAEPTVAVLLATYQGQNYLAAQLESLQAQVHTNWRLWASDDGSTDDTIKILKCYQSQWSTGRLSILNGPGRGYVANFLSLICDPEINAEYFSYADQDDVWEKDKIARALDMLKTVPAEIPALYFSRSRLVDKYNNEVGISPLHLKRPDFKNALMQNLGSGNTMVLNRAARNLIKKAGQKLVLNKHDWWTYLVVSGCGGKVFYDPVPSIRYRQHGNNQVGMNQTWRARLRRIGTLWNGRFSMLNDQHLIALQTLQSDLSPENRVAFQHVLDTRRGCIFERLSHLRKSGVYRQTVLGNLGLFVCVIFGKF